MCVTGFRGLDPRCCRESAQMTAGRCTVTERRQNVIYQSSYRTLGYSHGESEKAITARHSVRKYNINEIELKSSHAAFLLVLSGTINASEQ